MNRFPMGRTATVVVQNLDTETLIYDLTANKAYMLNETSAFVWQQLDGQTSIADISRKLGAQFKQPANEDIVRLAIDGLKSNNLLDEADQIPISFAGRSRREAIKRIGLRTMIALPVISALIAPQAAHATSAAACSSPCSSPSNCQSGNCDQVIGVCASPNGGIYPGNTDFCDSSSSCSLAPSICCSESATLVTPQTTCSGNFQCRCN